MSPQFIHIGSQSPVGQAPVNISLPTIDYSSPEGLAGGTATVIDPGTWTNSPTSFIYEWRFPGGLNPLPGNTGNPSIVVDAALYGGFLPTSDREIVCFVSAVNAFGQSAAVSSNSKILNLNPFDNTIIENARVTFGGFTTPPDTAVMTLVFPGRVLGVPTGPNSVSINDTTGFLGSTGNSYSFRSDITDGSRNLRLTWLDGSKPLVMGSNGVNTPLDILTTNPPATYIRGGLPNVTSFPVISGGTNVGDTITVTNVGSYAFNPNGPSGFPVSLDIGRIQFTSDNIRRQNANIYQPGVNDSYVIRPEDRGHRIQVSLNVGINEDGATFGGNSGTGFAPWNEVKSVGIDIPL